MSEVVKAEVPAGHVSLIIDGIEVTAPKGELLIRTAERLGIEIPRFCDHPLLEPAGACRQCLVDVEGQRKPVASCTQTVADGMVVRTQLTSPVAKKAQEGIMELLLVNHPLDCPMCDKGGECPLQNQAMSTGRADTRFREDKREYPKPINISTQVLLDRERCVLCQRCTRFSEEIAGDKFIDLMERSSNEQIGIDPEQPFNSYFSGNTIQICPVGALTGAQYRFRARPFDLVSSPSVCEHCSAGCAQRTDHRRNKVLRRLAGDDPAVNEEWNCDKGRWGFQYATATDRLTAPLVRDSRTGALREASWPEALRIAGEGLRRARDGAYGVAVLTGGRLTVEDAFAYSKFARAVLETNDIDFRARPIAAAGDHASAEEAAFLASTVAGSTDVSYSDVDNAPAVVLVALEPEEECPILFLRLRKAHTKSRLVVHAVAPFAARGLTKLGATVLATAPGDEAATLAGSAELKAALGQPGAILFVGERLAEVKGGLSAAVALAAETGAKLAWVPRRAGDRGAVDAGCLPNLLPERATGDRRRCPGRAERGLEAQDRHHLRLAGRDTDAIIAAAAAGQDRRVGRRRRRPGRPVGPGSGRAGTGQCGLPGLVRGAPLRGDRAGGRGVPGGSGGGEVGHLPRPGRGACVPSRPSWRRPPCPTRGCWTRSRARWAWRSAARTSTTSGASCGSSRLTEVVRLATPKVAPATRPTPGAGSAILATWPQLVDDGRMLDGDNILRGTARPAVVRMSKQTAAGLGNLADGDLATVSSGRGSLTLPVALTEMPDGVVWLPTNSPGSAVRRALGVSSGAVVSVTREPGVGGA